MTADVAQWPQSVMRIVIVAAAMLAVGCGGPGVPRGGVDGVSGAMNCADDPVVGRWTALKYDSDEDGLGDGAWVHFGLIIHRNADGTLSGTITSRIWAGGPGDRTPPECAGPPNRVGDYTTRMLGHGHADSQYRVTFRGSNNTTTTIHCTAQAHAYADDSFSGTIDPGRQEFRAVNNDGAYDRGTAYVFHRVGCNDE